MVGSVVWKQFTMLTHYYVSTIPALNLLTALTQLLLVVAVYCRHGFLGWMGLLCVLWKIFLVCNYASAACVAQKALYFCLICRGFRPVFCPSCAEYISFEKLSNFDKIHGRYLITTV